MKRAANTSLAALAWLLCLQNLAGVLPRFISNVKRMADVPKSVASGFKTTILIVDWSYFLQFIFGKTVMLIWRKLCLAFANLVQALTIFILDNQNKTSWCWTKPVSLLYCKSAALLRSSQPFSIFWSYFSSDAALSLGLEGRSTNFSLAKRQRRRWEPSC